jgi:hypothetical protein
MWREPFAKRRCLVPASGLYEWPKPGHAISPTYIPEPEPVTDQAPAGESVRHATAREGKSAQAHQASRAHIENFLCVEEVGDERKTQNCRYRLGGEPYDVLMSWPKAVRSDFGYSLREMQQGHAAKLETRRMESIGKGVFELKDSDDSTWYRMMYLTRVDDV